MSANYLRPLTRLVLVSLLLFCGHHSYAQKKQGQALIDSLLLQLPKAQDDTNKALLFNVLGNIYTTINPDEGEKYVTQGLALSQKLQWKRGEAGAYNVLGICAAYRSEYSVSIERWEQALAIYESINDKKGILKIVGNLGVMYARQGDHSHALENYYQALKYAEELGDKYSESINLGNIGELHASTHDDKKALEFYLKAMKICEEIGDKKGMANYLGNIGNEYIDMKQDDEALKYELKALDLNSSLGNTEGIIRDMVNIGPVYGRRGDHKVALDYYFKALTYARQAGLKLWEARTLDAIGEDLFQIARDHDKEHGFPAFLSTYNIPLSKQPVIDTAIQYLKKSIALEAANLNELQHDYEILSAMQKEAGYTTDALQSMEWYIAIKDSVFSVESKVKIANLDAKREVELKDKQIQIDKLEIAKKRNEQVFFIAGIALLLIVVVIVIRNIRLAAAKESSENKLNAFQARMNPHFIFNSLNSIQYLVLNNENELSIDYLSEFSTLMRQILDNSAKSKVVLKTEIDMLRSYIQLEHLRFDYFKWDIRIADNVSENNVEVPGIIIQPFVENAILHGLTPKGKDGRLDITFERDNKQIICTVEDNGIGRARSQELNSKKNKDRQSHGINIATNRLALLNDKKKGLINKVTYIDKQDNGVATGTKVIIQIPVL